MSLVILYQILGGIIKAEAETIKLKTLIKGMEKDLGKSSCSIKERIVKTKTAIEEIGKELEEADSILRELAENARKKR